MRLASDFNIKSRKETVINNKQDIIIAKLKSQLHETRQRAYDYQKLNKDFTTLQSKVDLLKSSHQHSYYIGEVNQKYAEGGRDNTVTEFKNISDQLDYHRQLNEKLQAELAHDKTIE